MDPKERIKRMTRLGLLGDPMECDDCEWTTRQILEGEPLKIIEVHPHTGVYLEGRKCTHETECKSCDGWGFVKAPCDHGPDCCEVDVPCDDCSGQGMNQDCQCECETCCDVAELVEDEREDERVKLTAMVRAGVLP